jgi:hypothetical protein
MRTFPRELAAFREMVNERGERLRQLTFTALQDCGTAPLEHVMVESRSATIGVIVLPGSDGAVRVVVQGFMKNRFFPGSSVALDGFYKYPDGRVVPMPDNEFYEFG